MKRIYFWIENNSDRKYIGLLIKHISNKLEYPISIYDRSSQKLFKYDGTCNISEVINFEKMNTVEFLKKINNKNSYLVTAYNMRKRDIQNYENIKVIQLSHSLAGWTGYNIETVIPFYDNMFTIYPELFRKMIFSKDINKRLKTHIKNFNKTKDKYPVKYHYRLLYLLSKPFTLRDKNRVLFLPHWTNKLSNIEKNLENINNKLEILLKLHPQSINEITIFLNRQFKGGSETKNKEKSNSLQKIIDNMKDNNKNLIITNDNDNEFLETLLDYEYILFDNQSNTLIETISINKILDKKQKILCIKPIQLSREYYLYDNMDVPIVENIKSLDDFVLAKKYDKYNLYNEDSDKVVETIINDYTKMINKIVNEN